MTLPKYFTVTDVQFDPHNKGHMASSGHDCTVRFWNCEDGVSPGMQMEFKDVPHELHYHPDEPILAVTCHDGCVYLYRNPGERSTDSVLHIAPKAAHQSAGAMVWGCERTQHVLFASSEPRDADDETGYHRAFDIHTQKQLYELDAKEGGDAMAIDPTGSTLALFTLGPGASHVLRLFDLRAKRARRAVHKAALDAFRFARGAPACDGEVTAAAFSPDGALLAAARNDNQLHVYDARFLARGPLLRFCHWGAERCAPGNRFGVTEAKWVRGWGGLGLGLVSGGMDGCVRLWDVRLSDETPANGTVLAQVDYDINAFSLGDVYSGERPLVVGDSGAGVYVYDRTGRMENLVP